MYVSLQAHTCYTIQTNEAAQKELFTAFKLKEHTCMIQQRFAALRRKHKSAFVMHEQDLLAPTREAVKPTNIIYTYDHKLITPINLL